MLTQFDNSTFNSEVTQGTGTVVVDFYAPWCRYCPPMQKTVEAVAVNNPAVTFAKVNTDDQPEVAHKASIRSLPTVVVYRGGQEVTRLVGVQPPAALQKVLDGLA